MASTEGTGLDALRCWRVHANTHPLAMDIWSNFFSSSLAFGNLVLPLLFQFSFSNKYKVTFHCDLNYINSYDIEHLFMWSLASHTYILFGKMSLNGFWQFPNWTVALIFVVVSCWVMRVFDALIYLFFSFKAPVFSVMSKNTSSGSRSQTFFYKKFLKTSFFTF